MHRIFTCAFIMSLLAGTVSCGGECERSCERYSKCLANRTSARLNYWTKAGCKKSCKADKNSHRHYIECAKKHTDCNKYEQCVIERTPGSTGD